MNPVAITRKNYWQVNGNDHATELEAFEDATNQALAAPGTIVQVQPPAYTVVYTAPAAPPADPTPVSPPPPPPPPPVEDPPPSDPPPTDPPPTDGTDYAGALAPGETFNPPSDA